MFYVNAHYQIALSITSAVERFGARNLKLSANFKTNQLQQNLKIVEINN